MFFSREVFLKVCEHKGELNSNQGWTPRPAPRKAGLALSIMPAIDDALKLKEERVTRPIVRYFAHNTPLKASSAEKYTASKALNRIFFYHSIISIIR